MRYMFLKRYNPAYDFFLIQYFREGGIEFDENTTFDEADQRELFSIGLTSMTPHEKLFCSYVRSWRMHPEARPSYYELFDKAIGGSGSPDAKRLLRLESNKTQRNGRLVFSEREAAVSISEFYRKFLRNPLKMELERGGGGKDVTKFFSMEELRPLLEVRQIADEEEKEKLRNGIAKHLLEWFTSINPEKVESDIQRTLREHEEVDDHMKLLPDDPTAKERSWSCRHASECVEIDFFQQFGSSNQSVFLKPSRGFRISDYVEEPGRNDIVFPWYLVVRTEWQAEGDIPRARKAQESVRYS